MTYSFASFFVVNAKEWGLKKQFCRKKKKFQILGPMMGNSITAKFFKNKNKNAYLVHASTEHTVIP